MMTVESESKVSKMHKKFNIELRHALMIVES